MSFTKNTRIRTSLFVNVAGLLLAATGCCSSMRTTKAPPHIAREDIEWGRAWVTGVNQTDRPHVLLIGDSITEAYSAGVEKRLTGIAYISRLATSKSLGDPAYLREVVTVLGNTPFDVVHFNNGMHGVGYSETEYERDFAKLIRILQRRAPKAKLIGATTTPKRRGGQLDQFPLFNDRIVVRNRIARTLLEKANLQVDDLFALVESHPDFYSPDGIHFNSTGIDAEAAQVADQILAVLK